MNAGLAVLLVALAVRGVQRGLGGHMDWVWWETEARLVWERAAIPDNTGLFGYPPAAFLWLIPLAAWPTRAVGVSLMVAINLGCLLAAGAMLSRRFLRDAEPPGRPPFWLWAGGPVILFVGSAAWDVFTFNQLNLIVLALAVAGLAGVAGGRSFWGGVLLGAAATLKPPAGLLVLFCGWSGRWRAFAGAAAGGAAFGLLPCLLFFGPAGTLREHLAWLGRVGSHGHGFNFSHPFDYPESESLSVALTHWLRRPPDAPTVYVVRGSPPPAKEAELRAEEAAGGAFLDRSPIPPDPLRGADWSVDAFRLKAIHRLQPVDLPVPAVAGLWLALTAASAGWLLWATRTARTAAEVTEGSAGTPDRWWAAASLWMLGMLWFSPHYHSDHLVWEMPAVAVVLSAVHRAWRVGDGRRALRRLAVPAFCLGMQLLSNLRWARFYGPNLPALALLAWTVAGQLRPRPAERSHPTEASA